MSGSMTEVVQQMLDSLGSGDASTVGELITDDVQGVDEITRRWIRGRAEMTGYLEQLLQQVSDVRSEIKDVQEQQYGDVGVVTCWLEQSYTYDGTAQQISAPTTVVLRIVDGRWKAALFHSVPLPQAEA